MGSEVALRSPHPLYATDPTSGERPVDGQSGISELHAKQDATLSDEELLSLVATASKEALAALFERHARPVFHIARRILRDEAEAADVRQDVFLYIFDKAGLFDPKKGSGVSWIMQIAYHRAIDRRRYLANRQHYDSGVFDEQQLHGAACPALGDMIDGKAILSRLREALSDEQRTTLELHLFEGYSLREIAEKNGQSLGNVRHHYYRALDRLRTQIFPQKGR